MADAGVNRRAFPRVHLDELRKASPTGVVQFPSRGYLPTVYAQGLDAFLEEGLEFLHHVAAEMGLTPDGLRGSG